MTGVESRQREGKTKEGKRRHCEKEVVENTDQAPSVTLGSISSSLSQFEDPMQSSNNDSSSSNGGTTNTESNSSSARSSEDELDQQDNFLPASRRPRSFSVAESNNGPVPKKVKTSHSMALSQVPGSSLAVGAVDLTTAAGQRTAHPEMSLEEARVEARREYNRQNAARARVRQKEQTRQLQQTVHHLQERIVLLERENQELRQLCAQRGVSSTSNALAATTTNQEENEKPPSSSSTEEEKSSTGTTAPSSFMPLLAAIEQTSSAQAAASQAPASATQAEEPSKKTDNDPVMDPNAAMARLAAVLHPQSSAASAPTTAATAQRTLQDAFREQLGNLMEQQPRQPLANDIQSSLLLQQVLPRASAASAIPGLGAGLNHPLADALRMAQGGAPSNLVPPLAQANPTKLLSLLAGGNSAASTLPTGPSAAANTQAILAALQQNQAVAALQASLQNRSNPR